MLSGRMTWQIARLVFSVGLVALIASRVDLVEMAETLAGANLWLVCLAFLVALGSWVIGTYKWRLLLRALGSDAPFAYLLGLNLVGLFYSLFLPGQIGGEVVKGIKLARYGVSGAATTVTIAVDRITGLIAIALLALAGLALAPETAAGPSMKLAALAVLLVSLSPLLVLPAVPWLLESESLRGWRSWGAARLVLNMAGTLLTAFLQYRQTRGALAVALLLSVGIQSMVVAVNYLAALSLGLDIPVLALTWIVTLTSVLHLIPLSLAGLGVREGAYVVLLQGYGIASADGLGLALLVFGLIVAQGLVGGLVDLAFGLGLGARQPRTDVGPASPHPPARRS